MNEVRINLNEVIKVKLTDLGKDIYYNQFDELNRRRGIVVCAPSFPKEDAEGYTKFQLWDFMRIYGEHIGMARPNVIKPLEIVYEPLGEAADVVKVRNAHWILHISDIYPADSTMECSSCNEEQLIGTSDSYCPNCGAVMDGGTAGLFEKAAEAIENLLKMPVPARPFFGLCNCDEKIERTDCDYYDEEQDMGAHIPYCKLYGRSGYCPCLGCEKYKQRAMPLPEPPKEDKA